MAFHDREGFTVWADCKPFVIMECLLKSHVRKSHPSPQAHFPRVRGAFIADRIIVGLYPRYRKTPRYRVGKGPR